MAEMTAVEYLREKARMTKADKEGRCGIQCGMCGLKPTNSTISCHCFELVYPEKAVSIVQKWTYEHPRKTILQDFLEKYPNAPKRKSGEPSICPESLGYRPEGTGCHAGCYECWNRPLEE